MQRLKCVAIIGVGLIGGSIGLALRKRKLAKQVIGIGRRKSSLANALSLGCVTRVTTSIARGAGEADVIVVCTPVEVIAKHVAEAASHCPEGAILTDAGSVKAEIVREANTALARIRRDVSFVGSHPIAGGERTGCQAARADLFQDRVAVVTPLPKTSPDAVARVGALWTALGARVTHMPPDDHDAALALTSHLPHLLASALSAATPARLLNLAGSGWQDTTRIAAGDPELWRQIFLANAAHTLSALDNFERVLAWFRSALQSGDGPGLIKLLAEGKSRRDTVGS
jgi:prephenate dehydrogenase